MKKITVILFALMMLATSAQAQLSIGVKGGVNLTKFDLDNAVSSALDSKNQVGFFVGPTATFMLPIVGVGVDASVLYSQVQGKLCDATMNADVATIKQQSIAVPVNVRYSLPVLPVYVFAGPQLDFNIGDKKFDVSDMTFSNYSAKDSRFSVNVGAGVKLSSFQVSVNYNIPCGDTGGLGIDEALHGATNTKSHTWQAAVAYYF